MNRNFWKDCLTALVLGAVVVFLLWLQPFPWLHPLVWTDAAAGAGLRPSATFMPGLGRAAMMWVYDSFTPDRAVSVLQWAGRISGGVIAIFALLILNESLPRVLRQRLRLAGWGREVVRRILLLGVMFFVCNEAVWRAGQCFSATTLHLLLILPAIWLVVRFLVTGRIWCVYVSMALWGILTGDTPVGAVGGLVSWALVFWKSLNVSDMTLNPIGNPLVRFTAQRRMSSLYFLLACSVVALNIWSFFRTGGVSVADSEVLDTLCRYGLEYVNGILPSMTGAGWLFAFLFALGPMVACLCCVGLAIEDDKFLPTRYIILFLVMGVLAWSQICGFSPFWFRSWIREPLMVKSELAIALTGLMDVVAFTYALCVLGGDVYFRNFRRISAWQLQDAAETPEGQAAIRSLVQFNRFSQIAVWVLPFLLVLSVLPMRRQVAVRQMLTVIADYCRQIVCECGDVKWVFTDGALDAGLELAAHADGKRLYPISMMSRHEPYDIAIRQRGVTDEEDLIALENGVPDTLRTWVYDKPERHPEFAVQVGLELWKRSKDVPYPQLGGLVARQQGMLPETAAQETVAAHKLAETILGLHRKAKLAQVDDYTVREDFLFVQWRVARMCRMRADRCAITKNEASSDIENKYADDLDNCNEAFKRIQRQKEWVAINHNSRLMPREGLKISLERADYKMAEPFAQNVLLADPDDAQANFALGMKCFFEESYGQSARYLEKVLLRKPNEPSVLNNLAVVATRLGRYGEAIAYAEKAVKAAPDAPEIKRTLEKAQKLLASAKEQ